MEALMDGIDVDGTATRAGPTFRENVLGQRAPPYEFSTNGAAQKRSVGVRDMKSSM